jgi:hypothetical protein
LTISGTPQAASVRARIRDRYFTEVILYSCELLTALGLCIGNFAHQPSLLASRWRPSRSALVRCTPDDTARMRRFFHAFWSHFRTVTLGLSETLVNTLIEGQFFFFPAEFSTATNPASSIGLRPGNSATRCRRPPVPST